MGHPMRFLLIATLVSGLCLGGCADNETVNPLPVDAGVPPDGGAGGGGGGGAAPVKRTVTQTNPFGDVKETENLLWDGDFEWFSVFSDEYAWIDGPMFDSYTFTNIVVGPPCISGLKCAMIAPGRSIAGIGVAAKGEPLEASFYAKPAGGFCAEVQGFVASIFTATPQDQEAEVKPVTKQADASGWCHYHAIIPARTEKPSLFIENKTTGVLAKNVYVDDCVLKVAPKGMHADASGADDEMRSHLDRARAGLAKRRGPHDPRPNDARRAFEAWNHRR